ncbi:MAG: hypothetical protein E7262_06645 [Lachnospiraceae bacterium]|nr:hypothetical protein [Lachnospiraceae bacterium]
MLYKKTKKTVEVTIEDTFDLKKEDYSREKAFVTLVNNWAWLCQNKDVLNEIEVKIQFHK